MGSGMLWAALAGGAQAGIQVLDDRAKRESDERQRALSIEDRKNALLFEMKAKADFARQEEEHASEVSGRVAERGARIGHERGARELEEARSRVPSEGEFANERITPEMIASMPPAARAIYERDMGLTDDSTLQGLGDQITASREIGAPASVRKGLLESYREEARTIKDTAERERRERNDDRRAEESNRRLDQRDAQMAQQFNISQQNIALGQQRIEAMERRGSGGGDAAAERRQEAREWTQQKAVADAVAKLDGDRKYRKMSEEEKVALVKKRMGIGADGAPAASSEPSPASAPKAVNSPWISDGAKAEQVRIIQSELAKDRAKGNAAGVAALERELARLGAGQKPAQQSIKRDNPSPSSAPVKVQDKAQYDALPKGARYVAPDGSVRTKG